MDLDQIYTSCIPLSEKRRLAQFAVTAHGVSKGSGEGGHECSDDELKLQYEQLLDVCKKYHLGENYMSRPSIGDLTSYLKAHQLADLAKKVSQSTRGRHARAHYRGDLVTLVTDTLDSIAEQIVPISEPAPSCQKFHICSSSGSEADEGYPSRLSPSCEAAEEDFVPAFGAQDEQLTATLCEVEHWECDCHATSGGEGEDEQTINTFLATCSSPAPDKAQFVMSSAAPEFIPCAKRVTFEAIETCTGEEVDNSYSSGHGIHSSHCSQQQLNGLLSAPLSVDDDEQHQPVSSESCGHDGDKQHQVEFIVAQAIEQLTNGSNWVYVKGVPHRQIHNVLLRRPDLFHVQHVWSKAGHRAFNVSLQSATDVQVTTATSSVKKVKEISHEPELRSASVGSCPDDMRSHLLHRVKSFQQASRDRNSVWKEYCDTCGFSYNLGLIDTVDLQLFFIRVRFQTASPKSDMQSPPIGGSRNLLRPHRSLS